MSLHLLHYCIIKPINITTTTTTTVTRKLEDAGKGRAAGLNNLSPQYSWGGGRGGEEIGNGEDNSLRR